MWLASLPLRIRQLFFRWLEVLLPSRVKQRCISILSIRSGPCSFPSWNFSRFTLVVADAAVVPLPPEKSILNFPSRLFDQMAYHPLLESENYADADEQSKDWTEYQQRHQQQHRIKVLEASIRRLRGLALGLGCAIAAAALFFFWFFVGTRPTLPKLQNCVCFPPIYISMQKCFFWGKGALTRTCSSCRRCDRVFSKDMACIRRGERVRRSARPCPRQGMARAV